MPLYTDTDFQKKVAPRKNIYKVGQDEEKEK